MISALAMPVNRLADLGHDAASGLLHPRWERRHTRMTVAVGVVFAGAFLASLHQPFVPHFIWDGVAYSIHGLGLAPIAERLVKFWEAVE